jgi:hypothetical protein
MMLKFAMEEARGRLVWSATARVRGEVLHYRVVKRAKLYVLIKPDESETDHDNLTEAFGRADNHHRQAIRAKRKGVKA